MFKTENTIQINCTEVKNFPLKQLKKTYTYPLHNADEHSIPDAILEKMVYYMFMILYIK